MFQCDMVRNFIVAGRQLAMLKTTESTSFATTLHIIDEKKTIVNMSHYYHLLN